MEFNQQDYYNLQICENYIYEGGNYSFIKNVLKALALVGIIMAIAMYGAMNDFSQDFLMITASFGPFIIIGYIVYEGQFKTMRKLTEYFRDENGVYFKVTFMSGASRTVSHYADGWINVDEFAQKQYSLLDDLKLAKSKEAAYYFVKRWKQGCVDWQLTKGGTARVVLLWDLKRVMRGITGDWYTYSVGNTRNLIKIRRIYKFILK